MRTLIAAVFLIATLTFAGTLVDQGMPGKQGPWPVTVVSGGGGITIPDGGLPIAAPDGGLPVIYVCNTRAQSVVSVGVAASTFPVNVATRWYTRICNSAENTGVPLVKCRDDGVNPVMGIANAGEVLEVGDCVTYYTPVAIRCISNTAATAVTQSECQ